MIGDDDDDDDDDDDPEHGNRTVNINLDHIYNLTINWSIYATRNNLDAKKTLFF